MTPATSSPSSSGADAPGARPGARHDRSTDPAVLLDAASKGDRVALARLLTQVENGGAPSRAAAALAYRSGCEPRSIGITGPPGAGQLGVLAVDPSSPFTGGAILGDRVRMQDHALDAGVFIRSMASRGHLGGLALATPQAVRVLDAAGKPWVIIETVGVGQVEVEIAGAADTT